MARGIAINHINTANYTSHHDKGNDSLVYGTEVVIPVEIGLRMHRMQHFNKETNQEALRLYLDLIDELKEMAKVRNTTHSQQVACYYNFNVREKQFQVGDLILRNTEASLLTS